MDLSIIIVTYNSEEDIKKCLESIIKKTEGVNYEVVVIDNNSLDNTVKIVNEYVKKYANIKIICTENRGFNAGNNIGIKNSIGDYIALLNPDTILLNNAFKIILDNMKIKKDVGACGASLYNEDMSLNMTHGSFPTLKETLLRSFKFRNDATFYLPDLSKKIMEVEFPSGADFVFKRELINKIGLMDEDYFIYFDETDYALRIKKLGLKCYIYTGARIVHAQGKSTEGVSDFAEKMFIESYAKYLKKNVSKIEAKSILYVRITEYYLKLLIMSIFKSKCIKKNRHLKEELLKYKNVLRQLN